MGRTKKSYSKKFSKRKQKMYNMRGCSKTRSKTRKLYLGGSSDVPLAYTGKQVSSVPNPFLSYTGKGGSGCGLSNLNKVPINTNAVDPTKPNTGSIGSWNTIFNNASPQLGGCGSCSSNPINVMKGGNCGANCSTGHMVGGNKHRVVCKCSTCKKKNMKGGNSGMPYPNGLVGSAWSPNSSNWPGIDGLSGNRNYYVNNDYNNDISRQMVDVGANPPYLKGGKKQKGGNLSNIMSQDLINLGRQFQFGVGSAYNALAGYSAPVNPMPWKDQFPSRTPFNPLTI